MPDKTIVCRDCGTVFKFSEGEQEFYASKDLSAPQRCKKCRNNRKLQRFGDQELYDTRCSDCGQPCKVPFKPIPVEEGGRIVLCVSCFTTRNRTGIPSPNRGKGKLKGTPGRSKPAIRPSTARFDRGNQKLRRAAATAEADVWLLDFDSGKVSQKLDKSLSRPAPAEVAGRKKLAKIDARFHVLRGSIRMQLKSVLSQLSGCEFVSLESKKLIASEIRRQLRRMELCVACPQCGQPSMLRAAAAGNSKQGVFQFDHSTAGSRSTHRGSSTFPKDLQIIDPAVDGREKFAKTALKRKVRTA